MFVERRERKAGFAGAGFPQPDWPVLPSRDRRSLVLILPWDRSGGLKSTAVRDSREGTLSYERGLIAQLALDPSQSVLEVGYDLTRPDHLQLKRRGGDEFSVPSPIQGNQSWLRRNSPSDSVGSSSIVICLNALMHQATLERYRSLAAWLEKLTTDTLIVAAYDCPPVAIPPGAFYIEPITATLAACAGVSEVSVIGKSRDDTCLVVARKRPSSGHFRDLPPADFNLMSAITDHPLGLRILVDTARAEIGFFPAQLPRAIEYPWVLANLPGSLDGKTVLDAGAGVNPLPLQFARRGAAVFTVDDHPVVRDPGNRGEWNEWGFLDYSLLDKRVTSVHLGYEAWSPPVRFDYIYSVSVIEHLPADVRRSWIGSFAAQLKDGGEVLLSVDLFAESNQLRNFSEGQVVEPEAEHGTLETVVEELTGAGFTVVECLVKRNIPKSRVDTGFIRARRAAPLLL